MGLEGETLHLKFKRGKCCIKPIEAARMDYKHAVELMSRMDWHDSVSMLSGIVFFISLFAYGKAVWKTRKLQPGDPNKNEPTKSTWIIWTVLDTETFVSQCLAHTVNGQIIGTLAGAYVVVVLALIYGKKGITTNEKWCIAGAVVGFIALIVLRHNPIVAMSISGSVSFLGSIETFKRAYRNSNCEPAGAWAIQLLSCVMQLIAINGWYATNIIQPITFTSIEATMVYLLWVRPRLTAAVRN